jgi:hypothetical protein
VLVVFLLLPCVKRSSTSLGCTSRTAGNEGEQYTNRTAGVLTSGEIDSPSFVNGALALVLPSLCLGLVDSKALGTSKLEDQ